MKNHPFRRNMTAAGLAAAGFMLPLSLAGCADTAADCTTPDSTTWAPGSTFKAEPAIYKYMALRLKEETGAAFGIEQIRNGKLAAVACAGGIPQAELSDFPIVTVTDAPRDVSTYCVIVGTQPQDQKSEQPDELKAFCPSV